MKRMEIVEIRASQSSRGKHLCIANRISGSHHLKSLQSSRIEPHRTSKDPGA